MYGVVINGYTLFFEGNIPAEKNAEIESILNDIKIQPYDTDFVEFKKNFITLIKNSLGIQLKEINITQMYRKKQFSNNT